MFASPLAVMAGTIFIVHDSTQAALRVAGALACEHAEIRTYGSAEAFLDQAVPAGGCVVVQGDLGGMGACGLIAAIRDRRLSLRIVALVRAGDVAVAASLLRAGANDVVEEPARPWRLCQAVREAPINGGS